MITVSASPSKKAPLGVSSCAQKYVQSKCISVSIAISEHVDVQMPLPIDCDIVAVHLPTVGHTHRLSPGIGADGKPNCGCMAIGLQIEGMTMTGQRETGSFQA